jgi:heat-inducible transcriptional repressor
MGSFELTERSRRLLAALVREYIETGEAVSSQVLARQSALGVSSATVRAALVQLEDAGYVHQPHTSAGRVPTDRGYRVFVDRLLEGRKPVRPSANVESRLRQATASPMMDDLVANVSHFVSKAARHVGFALASHQSDILQRI